MSFARSVSLAQFRWRHPTELPLITAKRGLDRRQHGTGLMVSRAAQSGIVEAPSQGGSSMWRTCSWLSAAILFCYVPAVPAQPAKMTPDQQEWLNCFVSKQWCVAVSMDKDTQQPKAIAMVSAKKPLSLPAGISRVTLQIACTGGKPIAFLATGRTSSDSDLMLRYRVEPSGAAGAFVGKHAGDGHFFEITDADFINALKASTKLTFETTLAEQKKEATLEFNVAGFSPALKKLDCAN